jgi:hypothetical protein
MTKKRTKLPGKKKAPKRVAKKATSLARARETHVVASHDIADDEDIVRHMSTEDLAHSPQTRALAIIHATQQPSAAQQLAYGAFLDLLDTDRIVVVREDDGSLWAFVPNDPSPDRWRGALRLREGRVERSRFLPHEGKIVWDPVE